MSQAAMVSQQRAGAEVYHGEEACKRKAVEMLEELHLPRGLLPLSGLEEVGRNRETGFVWLKQAKPKVHVFKKTGKHVSYAEEVTAFVDDRRMKKVTGVKSKELLIWVTLSEMYIDNPASGKITFKTSAGITKSFPVSDYDDEDI